MPTGGEFSKRILVFAPVGRDAELLIGALCASNLLAQSTGSSKELAESIREGCGAVLLTEEALFRDAESHLRNAVSAQATWSEVPFVVLTSRDQGERVRLTIELLQPLRNVTVLERPVRSGTIYLALDAALRDRQRQYDIRESLEHLQRSNRELEQRVDERTSELRNKVRELESFCYSVSHDMRAPLRAITANATMVLEDETSVSTAGRDRLLRLSIAAVKMGQLIDDLLSYARLGDSDLRRTSVDLSALVNDVIDEVRHERGVHSLSASVQPGLSVKADPRLMAMAIRNLVDNAVKYQTTGTQPSIEFGQDNSGAYYLRDNGIGFDMAYAGKIFQPFERLHRDDAYPGTGIGLANVRRVFDLHGGSIWAESELDHGATFLFTLQ